MSPAEVRAYADALKGAGLMSCHIRVPVTDGVLELALQFAPPEVPLGELPTPGGWKGPERLDKPMELDPPGTERTVTKD